MLSANDYYFTPFWKKIKGVSPVSGKKLKVYNLFKEIAGVRKLPAGGWDRFGNICQLPRRREQPPPGYNG